MPGPRSPARKAKEQHAKEKFKNRNVEKSYEPPHDSIVHQLSIKLTDAGRTWWSTYGGSGKEFEAHKGNRGGQQGAMAWIRDTYVTKWWDIHFPEALGASEKERAWFFQTSGNGRLIWSYLDGFLRKENNRERQGPSKIPGKVLQRAVAHDAYRREHPETYDEAVEQWVDDNGSKPSLANKRKLSQGVFKKLSNQEQKEFREKAVAAVKESRQLARVTDPKEHARLTRNFWNSLRELLLFGSGVTGIEVCALVVHETEDGKTRVTRELSKGIEGFANSTRLAKSMDALKDYLEALNDTASNPIPLPRVYPDYTKDGYPGLPNFEGWSLKRMRKLLRDFIKAVFKFQGGVGRMIWKEIKAMLNYWLDPRRLPKVEGLVWDDPAYLSKRMVRIWLNFFLACITGKVPPEECFQFYRVPAGPSPIHPSESQETRREEVTRDGNLVCLLVFEDRVTKCHRVGGMTYDTRAIDYANYVAFNGDPANSIASLQGLGLPVPGPNIPASVFFGLELERLTKWVSNAPEGPKTRVLTILDTANTYQEHLPVSHPIGVWLREGGIPLVLAQSPQEALNHSKSFWLPPDYFLPPGLAALQGTLYFFEAFQDELYEGGLICHVPSKTFYGGHTGVAAIVRALIQIYLNCLAVQGVFQPPEKPPAGYDISRFVTSEHDRIVGWMDKWAAVIKRHTVILAETSAERKSCIVQSGVRPSSGGSDMEDSHGSGSGSDSDSDSDSEHSIAPAHPSPPPPTSDTGPSSPDVGPSSCNKGKKHEKFADYSDSSDDAPSEIDYEAIDQTSQDDKSSDEGDLERFNERFLDDDSFPADDSIGLRERYGFDSEVKFHLHTGWDPYEEIIHDDLWFPGKTEPLFGGFPELCPYKAPRLSRPDTAMRLLISLGIEATRVKARWYFYNRENPRLGSELRHRTKDQAIVFSSPVRSLMQVVLVRIVAWLRAKAMAPYVYAHWASMAYLLREALHLFATSEHLIQAGDFSDSEFTAEDLANQVIKAKRQVVELSYVHGELQDWHALSTRFMNRLRGNWLLQRPPPLGKIIEIVEGTQDWIDASYALGVKHAEQRPKKWNELLDTPYEPPEEGMNYLFGCPTRSEESRGLENDLQEARKMDPFFDVLDEVANTPWKLEMALSECANPNSLDLSAVDNTPAPAPSTIPSPTDPAPQPIATSALQRTADGGDNMGGDAPCLSTSVPRSPTLPPPASPSSKPKAKRKAKVKPKPTSVIEPAPAVEPTPTSSIAESGPNPVVTSAPKITTERTESIGVEPSSAGSPPATTLSSPYEAQSETASPSVPRAIPRETRGSRKRKSAPETETDAVTDNGRGRRASARLQGKPSGSKVGVNAKEGQGIQRKSTRLVR
ncbi:unnamed protein product [Rhizoctonia solani]|uniref:Uncharacterized protein n=1 Tax=Rhizoctonia solani TaxID=456999 RepID=A0A8H3HXG1_9AGAM|nr:unnamed protein product [Rhizoctonia solani]